MCTLSFQLGGTALMIACTTGHVEVVKALLVAEPKSVLPSLLENLKPNRPTICQKTAALVIEALASFVFPYITPSFYGRLELLAKCKTESEVKVAASHALEALKLEEGKRTEVAMRNSQQLLDDLAAEAKEAQQAKEAKKGKKKKQMAQQPAPQPANRAAKEAAGAECRTDESRCRGIDRTNDVMSHCRSEGCPYSGGAPPHHTTYCPHMTVLFVIYANASPLLQCPSSLPPKSSQRSSLWSHPLLPQYL